MQDVSSTSRQIAWRRQPRRVSVLAEMALRREKVTERLLELRERHGLSQEDAAHKVGITTRQWQRWETGESMPYPRNLDAVASAFGISIVEFFDPEPVAQPADADQLDRIEAKLDLLLQTVIPSSPAEVAEEAAARRTADKPSAAGSSRAGKSGSRRVA
jgi:transcriptional regulator with XRE-family HTH domain